MPLTVSFPNFIPGTTIFSSQTNTNNADIENWANAHELAVTGVHGVGAGQIVGTTLTQVLSNKIFSDNLVWLSGTSFQGILDHANTASRTYTFPDANGSVPALPTAATTETGTGAVVRSAGPTISNPTITGTVSGGATYTGLTFGSPIFSGTITGTYTLGGTPSIDASAINSGILPVVRGGTGVATSTGTGNTVLSNDPTFGGNGITLPITSPPTAGVMERHSNVIASGVIHAYAIGGAIGAGSFNLQNYVNLGAGQCHVDFINAPTTPTSIRVQITSLNNPPRVCGVVNWGAGDIGLQIIQGGTGAFTPIDSDVYITVYGY